MDWTNIHCDSEKIDGNDCRLLLRKEGLKPLVVIGLNPSTADESVPDATMRKIMGFIDIWNNGDEYSFDSFVMLNLYPQRETAPRELYVKSRSINGVIHSRNMEMITSILNTYPKGDVLLCYGDSIEVIPWMKHCKEEVLKLLAKYPDVSLHSLGNLVMTKAQLAYQILHLCARVSRGHFFTAKLIGELRFRRIVQHQILIVVLPILSVME